MSKWWCWWGSHSRGLGVLQGSKPPKNDLIERRYHSDLKYIHIELCSRLVFFQPDVFFLVIIVFLYVSFKLRVCTSFFSTSFSSNLPRHSKINPAPFEPQTSKKNSGNQNPNGYTDTPPESKEMMRNDGLTRLPSGMLQKVSMRVVARLFHRNILLLNSVDIMYVYSISLSNK